MLFNRNRKMLQPALNTPKIRFRPRLCPRPGWRRGGSGGKYLGATPPSEIDAPKAPSGERQRRENWGAKTTECDEVWGGGILLSIRLCLGSVVKLPHHDPAGNAFLRILKAKEHLLYTVYCCCNQNIWRKQGSVLGMVILFVCRPNNLHALT